MPEELESAIRKAIADYYKQNPGAKDISIEIDTVESGRVIDVCIFDDKD